MWESPFATLARSNSSSRSRGGPRARLLRLLRAARHGAALRRAGRAGDRAPGRHARRPRAHPPRAGARPAHRRGGGAEARQRALRDREHAGDERLLLPERQRLPVARAARLRALGERAGERDRARGGSRRRPPRAAARVAQEPGALRDAGEDHDGVARGRSERRGVARPRARGRRPGGALQPRARARGRPRRPGARRAGGLRPGGHGELPRRARPRGHVPARTAAPARPSSTPTRPRPSARRTPPTPRGGSRPRSPRRAPRAPSSTASTAC